MSEATRVNGGKRKPPKEGGSNARERARVAAVEAARRRKRRNLGLLVLAIVVVVAAVGIGIRSGRRFFSPGGGASGSGGTRTCAPAVSRVSALARAPSTRIWPDRASFWI